ncbi:MAG: M23 family metallopeptidase [Hyphomicrobiales bacterium]|nr:M23 family metallopeptidase [Hyphomicrobiales bacterium]
MPQKPSSPSERQPEGHFRITVARGGSHRRFSVHPGVVYGLVGVLPVVATVYLAATGFLFFRDDMIAALMARQARQQYAYEDRIAALRVQLDRVTSRQLLDQDSFEGKVQRLVSREAQLETRTAIVAALGEKIGTPPETTAAIAPAQKTARPTAANTPSRPTAFAPIEDPMDSGGPFESNKPRPDGFELRTRDADGPRANLEAPARAAIVAAADADIPTQARIDMLNAALDRIERRQITTLAALAGPAARKAEQLKAVIAETGLSPSRLAPPKSDAVGGPFVPVKLDDKSSPFERQLASVQGSFAALDRLQRALPYVPVRKPLAGPLEFSSGFGYRLDPFLGRPALHSGLDMRAETGTTARATASGVVTNAGWSGGYGNMVEIDHGNGLSTRYGHLSAILVSDGQKVVAGQPVGRVGSTGRSTGPHLHYEVRIDDEATDPMRFVKAARLMPAKD